MKYYEIDINNVTEEEYARLCAESFYNGNEWNSSETNLEKIIYASIIGGIHAFWSLSEFDTTVQERNKTLCIVMRSVEFVLLNYEVFLQNKIHVNSYNSVYNPIRHWCNKRMGTNY